MSEIYERGPFIFAYIKWHYSQGLREFLEVMGSFLWFIANFFSFKLLLKTLFMPWKRLGEHYSGGFDLGAFAGTLIVNGLMRAVGFVTKTLVLAVGIVAYLSVLVFAILILVVWLLAPFLLLISAALAVAFFVL